MDWEKELTEENFFAVYDVALDIHADLQLGQQPNIPMVPSLVKFRLLMPADGINMRDRYGNLRWKAMKFLEEKGVIRKIDLMQSGHRWQNRAKLQVNADIFKEVFASLETELRRRTELPERTPEAPLDSAVQKSAAPASTEFEKVTLLWLVHHIPLRLWLSALGIVFLIFVGGIHVGQLGFVREFLGKPSIIEQRAIEVPVLQGRIDRLTEAYNTNIRQITSQILQHEETAANRLSVLERDQHVKAADRLRALLDEEHKKYRAAVNDLKGLQDAK